MKDEWFKIHISTNRGIVVAEYTSAESMHEGASALIGLLRIHGMEKLLEIIEVERTRLFTVPPEEEI